MAWVDRIARLEGAIIALCSMMIAIGFSLVVVVRYVFHADLFAYEEIILPTAFALYFIGAARASYDDTHIKADLVLEGIRKKRTRLAYQTFIFCAEGLITLAFTYFALRMFVAEFDKYPSMPRTAVYQIPLAVPRFFILLGFALMSLHSFAHAYRHFLLFRSADQSDPEGSAR